MLTNEQRAHDLAILYMQAEINSNLIKIDSESIHAISFVSEYENIYSSMLEVIETSDETR